MDRNTITGLILIAAIIIGFSIYTKPSKEQMEEQRRIQDSIQLAERMKAEEQARAELLAEESLNKQSQQQSNVESFFSTGAVAAKSVTDTLVQVSDSVMLQADSLITLSTSKEETVVLENEKIRLLLNTKGGGIKSVQIKGFKRYDGDSLILFADDDARFNLELFNRESVRLSTENQYFTPIVSADGQMVTMRLGQSEQQYIDFIYTLPADEYMMDFDIHVVGMKNGLHPESLTNFRINWAQNILAQEKGAIFEKRFARMHYKYHKQDVQKMSESRNERKELSEPLKWFAFKDQYFTSIIIADEPFNNTILSSEVSTDADYIKDYKAETWVPIQMSAEEDLITAGFQYYFGPVHYKTLKEYDKNRAEGTEKLDLEEVVYLGYKWLSWVNKYFTIPVFNFFLSLGWGMGLIIFILTLLVKLIVAPLTYKSFMSTAKMRVLRPQIKAIEEKYPGQEQDMMLKRQQATMDLYNRAGASPMSGCLPQLIQMPVFLALFFFFPSAIELRQQSFLWADDLSTYDAIISWSGNIPIITRFLGNHISLFCLLMTTTNILYAKFNMQSMDTGQQQMAGMKYMPIFMSVFMFFFLNSYPSGLNYYYFLSTLITILLTILFKKLVDEDKLLKQMEENKKKPKKQSSFMKRLEEAQKMQEKQARERAKENAKRNYRR